MSGRRRIKASLESLVRAMRLSGRVPADLRLAPSTVHRVLAAHGVPSVPAGTPEPDARAFTFPHANDLWTSDVMHGPRLLVPGRRDGAKTYLLAFVDDATRMVPFAAFYASENAACFQDALKQALLRRGVPRRLYCDNGSTYRTHHLDVICATLAGGYAAAARRSSPKTGVQRKRPGAPGAADLSSRSRSPCSAKCSEPCG